MELISVIIPIYNVEKYLNRCIRSVLAQTYENLEIFLIDDGSTDGSLSICCHYKQLDSRVHVIHQENQGVSAARNAGLREAHGDVISMIDGDDYIHPQMYESMMSRMQRDQSDIVMCSYLYCDEAGNVARKESRSVRFRDEILDSKKAIKRFFWLNGDAYNFLWNKLYRKKVFEGVWFFGGRYNEDTRVLPQLYLNAEKISLVSKPFYKYVQRPGSITKSVSRYPRNLYTLENYVAIEQEMVDRGLYWVAERTEPFYINLSAIVRYYLELNHKEYIGAFNQILNRYSELYASCLREHTNVFYRILNWIYFRNPLVFGKLLVGSFKLFHTGLENRITDSTVVMVDMESFYEHCRKNLGTSEKWDF